jgi:hypothetical protein
MKGNTRRDETDVSPKAFRRAGVRVCPWLIPGGTGAGHGFSVFVASVDLSGGNLYFLARLSRSILDLLLFLGW